MSLKQQLEGIRANTPKEAQAVFDSFIQNIEKSGIMNNIINHGDEIPDFSLPDHLGNIVSSSELLVHGPLVISFYRGAWCPYCNLELQSLQAILPDIRELGANLIAISPNSPDDALTTKEKHDLDFHILTDQDNLIAKEFGLVVNVEGKIKEVMLSAGVDLDKFNGNTDWQIPIPATYIVNHDGIVQSFINADYTKRMEPSEIIKILENLSPF